MFTSFLKYFSLFFLFLLIVPTPASAHLIGGNGFASGAAHPLLGFDHLLAMVAVGVIASQIGGRALWTIPATFLSFLLIGGILGINGVALPFVETGIAISVLLFGSIIALSKKLPSTLAVVCVSFFAIFHGHAHGTEMSVITNPVLYTSGFLLSTALMHTFGVIVGYYAKKSTLSVQVLKTAGVFVSLAGVAFLFGL